MKVKAGWWVKTKAAVRTWEQKNKKQKTTTSKLHSQINAWQEAKKLL